MVSARNKGLHKSSGTGTYTVKLLQAQLNPCRAPPQAQQVIHLLLQGSWDMLPACKPLDSPPIWPLQVQASSNNRMLRPGRSWPSRSTSSVRTPCLSLVAGKPCLAQAASGAVGQAPPAFAPVVSHLYPVMPPPRPSTAVLVHCLPVRVPNPRPSRPIPPHMPGSPPQ